MAARLKRSAVVADLRRLSNAELSNENVMGFLLEINEVRNDRGAALLLARALENALAFALERRLKIPADRLSELFGPDRPASSFDDKIRLAYAIGLLKKETRDTIDLIKLIRNVFAHASNPVSFDVSEVSDACSLIDEPISLPPTVSGSDNPHRPVSKARLKYQKSLRYSLPQLVDCRRCLRLAYGHSTTRKRLRLGDSAIIPWKTREASISSGTPLISANTRAPAATISGVISISSVSST